MMVRRVILVVILCGWIGFSVEANAREFTLLVEKYEKQESVFTLRLTNMNALLKQAGALLGNPVVQIGGTGAMTEQLALCKECLVIVSDQTNKKLQEDVRKYTQKAAMEELLSVRTQGNKVELYVREEKNQVKEIVLYFESSERKINLYARLSGTFDPKTLQQFTGQLKM